MRERPVLHARDHWRKFPDAQPTEWQQVGVGTAAAFETGISGNLYYARDSAGETEVFLGSVTGWTSGVAIVFLPSSYWDYLTDDVVWVGWDTVASLPVAVQLSSVDGGIRLYESDVAGGTITAADITVDSTTLVGVGTDVQAVLEELDNAIAAGGAPTGVNYLVGTADATLTNEIVVGTSPGGELGGTWASPTVDATHSGSSHASIQAAAEATAAAALSAHTTDTTDAHDASAISVAPAGSLTADDVQEGLEDIIATLEASYPTPEFLAAGAAAEINTAPGDIAVPYPTVTGGILAGDLLLAQIYIRNNTNTVDSVPGGWFLLAGPDEQSSTFQQWIYYKIAAGGETGTQTWSEDGTALFMGRMYAFRNVTASGFAEDSTFGGANSGTVTIPDLTTLGANRLAVAFIAVGDANALTAASGESGGDWTEPVEEYTTTLGLNGAIGLQIAEMPAAATITGGTITMGASDPWGVRVFGLVPASAGFQALDATLTALAAADWAANALPIGTGTDTLAQTAFAANTFPARASTGNLVAKPITDFGLSLVDDADADTARATLGAAALGPILASTIW